MRKNLTEKYKMLRQLLHTPTPETTSKDPQIKRPLHRLLQKTDIYIYIWPFFIPFYFLNYLPT
jgi:hypothetical protein